MPPQLESRLKEQDQELEHLRRILPSQDGTFKGLYMEMRALKEVTLYGYHYQPTAEQSTLHCVQAYLCESYDGHACGMRAGACCCMDHCAEIMV